MSAGSEKQLRLFVAIYPPRALARTLLDALADLDLPQHRLTPLEQIHLTLLFIGDTPPRQVEGTIESARRATGGLEPFELTPLRLMALPKRGPSRLIAAETDAPTTLIELQRRLATRLAHNPRKDPGGRFRPHLTLCRFKKPSRIGAVDQGLSVTAFAVSRLLLMRSSLTPRGAEYHEVASTPLEGGH